jgi:hypothetical protein
MRATVRPLDANRSGDVVVRFSTEE